MNKPVNNKKPKLGKPLVSILITTKNEERNIENCLISIVNQTFDNIEVIIVDNYSGDKTAVISKKFTNKFYLFGPERSSQRNFGLKISKGKYVIFLDADMMLAPDTVELAVESMEKNSYEGLYISEIVLGSSYWSRVRRFERSFYDGTVIDGVRFIRRKTFLSIGGFDESLFAGEDWDLDKRVRQVGSVGLLKGKRLRNFINWPLRSFLEKSGLSMNCSGCIYHNESEFNLASYISKKEYYSGNLDLYIDKWGKRDPDIIKQFGLKYRLLSVFFEDGKWIILLKHPYLAAGMYFLRFLVGLKFLLRRYN